MARQALRDVSETTRKIMDGELDEELDAIAQAVKARLKNRFRRGLQVRVVGSNSDDLNGRVGTVIKVNPTRVTIGFGEKNAWGYEEEFNIPPSMLELVR